MFMKTASTGTPYRQASLWATLVLASATGCHNSASDPVAAAPIFYTQPTIQTATAGASATFTLLAQGPPDPTYQWFRTDDAGHTWTTLAGATGTSYTLPAVSINDNNAWFEAVATNLIGFASSNSAALKVTAPVGATFPITLPAGTAPLGIAPGPDGRLWFTSQNPGQIGMVSPSAKTPVLVALSNSACLPAGITAGPDGRMWFTESAAGKLGAITLDGTALTEYAAQGLNPAGIVTGPNGALWYTLPGSNAIGVMTPTGTAVTYPVTTAGASPQAITLGLQDSNLWFTESLAGRLGRITPAGTVTEWVIPTPAGGVTPVPQGLASTADGALWIADSANAQLVKFTLPATFLSIPLPAGAQPAGVTVDASGTLWVADLGLGQVSQVTPAGVVASFPLPAGSAGLAANLAIGSDGSLYLTETGAGAVTQLVTAVPTSGVAVSVMPGLAQVAAGLPMQFSAQVTGSPDTSVVWSIREGAAGGSITPTGLYTAPAAGGTYHVVAASHANSLEAGTAAVTVTSLSTPVISVPTYVTANATGLKATVPAQADCTYAWTVTGGTVTSGAGTHQITFTAGASGYVQLACTVTNTTVTASLEQTAVSTIAQPPVIASFTAAPATVASGGKVNLTAVFSAGGGTIDQGIGTITSGVAVTTGSLVASTPYTLTVTNAAGTATTAQVLVTVTP